MFERIVVGHDGTGCSEDALALGRDLARIGGGRVTIVRQYLHEPVYAGDGTSHPSGAPTSSERMLADLTRRFGEEFDVRSVAAHSAARGLHEIAEEMEADLIVVGSTHRGRIGRAIPGTTAERLLQGGPCAVALAPAGYQHRDREGLHRIGVAFCTSPEGKVALAEALALATAAGGTVEVLNVFEYAPQETIDTVTGELRINARECALADLEDAIAELLPGRSVAATVLDGHPVDALIERARDLDLLVMGSRGYGPVGRVLLGSVSHGVLTHGCPCPVIVVPRGAERHAELPEARATA